MNLTIRDIARLAGTSSTAVSFVLNGKDAKRVKPEKRAAILAVVQKYSYRRRTAAQGLTLRRSFRVAVCTPGTYAAHPLVGTASHHEIIHHSARRLHEAGYGIVLRQVDTSLPLPEVARGLAREEADGFLFVDFDAAVLDKILFSLAERRVPGVAVGTRLDSEELGRSWVAIDREGSFAAGTACLLEQGLRRIVMLDIDLSGTFTKVKRLGYERAMRAAGAEPLPTFAMTAKSGRAAAEAARRLVAAVPDVEGILLTDNLFAPVVQTVLADRRPRMLGFGDAIFAELCDPKLSYMRLPVASLAAASVHHLVQWIEKPDEHAPLGQLFPCELVIRDT